MVDGDENDVQSTPSARGLVSRYYDLGNVNTDPSRVCNPEPAAR